METKLPENLVSQVSYKDHQTVQRLLATIFLLYLVFVIYGSLVPLNLQHIPWSEAVQKFSTIPWLHLGIASRADWVANCLLFIPLAFFTQGVVTLLTAGSPRTLRLVLGLSIWLGCAALAVWIEFIQVFFPPRTVSLNDIAAETFGAMLGSALWFWRGKQLLWWLYQTFRIRGPRSLAQRLFYVYTAAYLFFQLLPLDLTISPVEIYHQWRMGRVVLVPFQRTPELFSQWFYDLATDIIFFVPIGYLAVRSEWIAGSTQKRVINAALYGLAISVAVEFLQLFVYSRVTDITDLVTAMLGAGIGAALAKTQRQEMVKSRLRFNSSWLWVALYCFVLLFVFWLPFDFGVSKPELVNSVNHLRKVPFYSYYYSTEFVAITAFLRQFLFFLPLGFLLSGCIYQWSIILRRLFASVFLFAIALLVELGQLFLPSRIADNTDIVIGWLGGIAGMAFSYWLNTKRLQKHALISHAPRQIS